MRILIVTNHFWPENFRVNDLAFAMVERGHEVTVLSGIPNYPEGKFFPGYGIFKKRSETHRGVQVHRVPLIPRGNGSGLRLAMNYLSSAFFFCLLAPWLARPRPDVVFVFETSPATIGLPAVLMKKIRKIPIVFWVLDLWPDNISATGTLNNRYALGLIKKIMKFIYRNCDEILISSRGFAKSILGLMDCQRKIIYFPNWVEPEMTRSLGTTTPIRLPEGFRIVFTGNVGVAQDFETILDAAESLKSIREIQWVIVGEGRRSEWLRQEVTRRELDDQFHCLGRFPIEQMTDFYRQADVLLLPLRKDPIFALTAPGKLQSYMSSGVPVLAAIDGEGADIVEQANCGLACPASDATALAKRVLEFHAMPKEKRKALGDNGKRYCEEYFDRELLFDQLETILEETCIGVKGQ